MVDCAEYTSSALKYAILPITLLLLLWKMKLIQAVMSLGSKAMSLKPSVSICVSTNCSY